MGGGQMGLGSSGTKGMKQRSSTSTAPLQVRWGHLMHPTIHLTINEGTSFVYTFLHTHRLLWYMSSTQSPLPVHLDGQWSKVSTCSPSAPRHIHSRSRDSREVSGGGPSGGHSSRGPPPPNLNLQHVREQRGLATEGGGAQGRGDVQ